MDLMVAGAQSTPACCQVAMLVQEAGRASQEVSHAGRKVKTQQLNLSHLPSGSQVSAQHLKKHEFCI